MSIDLHTHSSISDGTDTPTALLHAARQQGLRVIALTDHDTTAGWSEAAEAADRLGVGLVRGIEVSTRYRGSAVHLLAYLPDPEDPALQGELDRIVQGREQRVPAMLAQLRAHGIPATEQALAELVGEAVVGRPHVADLLVSLGVVGHRDEAFARYLGEGGLAFVDRYAPDLVKMIGIVGDAGGVPVVAHPWGRGSREVLDAEAFAELVGAGLAGIEVNHRDHDPRARQELRALAADLELIVTGASDHHGTGKTNHDLGCETTEPEQFERLLAAAQATASPTEYLSAAAPMAGGHR